MVAKVTQSPPGLLLLTSFLLHMEEGRASSTRLVCDNRLIQKYTGEAKDMEKRVVRVQSPPEHKTSGGHSSWYLTSASPVPHRASARYCLYSAVLQCCPWWTSASSSGNPNR